MYFSLHFNQIITYLARGVRSENIRDEGWVGGVSMSEK